MDKRKYINFFHLFIFFITILINRQILAGAWITEKGKYKLSSNLMLLDRASESRIRKAEALFHELSAVKTSLIEQIIFLKTNGDSSNYKTSKIAELNQEIIIIERKQAEILDFNEFQFWNTEIEYGLSNHSAISLSLNLEKQFKNNDHLVSREIALKTIHQIYEGKKILLSFSPILNYQKQPNYKHAPSVGGGIYIGVKGNVFKKFITSSEYGLKYMHNMGEFNYEDISVTFYTDLKLLDDLTFSNYTEMQVSFHKREILNKIIYEQLSLSKKIKLNEDRSNYLTVQFGYFLKANIDNPKLNYTGPIISAWIQI